MTESINQKLERVRKPRVHIKYEVETEQGVESRELPFVIGVLGDYSGDVRKPQVPLRDRKFTKIDKDNFNQVMANQHAGLDLKVKNVFSEKDTLLDVHLDFHCLDDFEPTHIVEQVPALNKLKDVRDKLRDLLSKSDRSDELEHFLEEILQDSHDLRCLALELGFKQKGDKVVEVYDE